MRVGWIGLGMMGLPMARRAARAGFSVVGHSRGRPAHRALVDDGGSLVADPAECAAADIVCVSVFTDDQVREVLHDGGVLAALRPGAVLVIHTTGDPAVSRQFQADAPSGVTVIDGAFSGTVLQAVDGTLTLMGGGPAEAFARVQPLFESYATLVRHVGPLGAGMQLKLINNLLFAAQVGLVGAAYDIAAAQGFDASTVRDVLGRCSAASRALEMIGADGAVAANLDRMRYYVEKDVAVAAAIAAAEGCDLGLVGAVAARFAAEAVSAL